MAKRITSEDLVLNLILNADKVKTGNNKLLSELYKLDRQTQDLNNRLVRLQVEKKKLRKTDANYANDTARLKKEIGLLNEKIKANETLMQKLRKEIGRTGLTVNQLRSHLQALRIQRDNATNPATIKRLNAEIKKTQLRLEQVTQGMSRMAVAWRHLGTMANKFGTLMGWVMLTIYGVSRAISSTTKNLRTLDRLFSNVMKTTSLTREEVGRLKREFDELDKADGAKTPTRTAELLSIARIAGRLGVRGVEDIRDFTLAVDKMYVSLQTDLAGSVEEVTEKVGKLVNVFNLAGDKPGQMPLDQALLRTGSLINELGKRSAANAEAILNYTARLGGVGSMANFTIDQLAGLGATLDANQVKAERGSTALVKLIVGLGKHAEEFARVLGYTTEEYRKRVEEDVNGVLIEMLEASANGNESIMDVVQSMDVMNVSGVRVAETFGKLTQNIEMLREQQDIAKGAFASSASVMNEFYIVSKDFDALMAIQGKRAKSLADDWSKAMAPAMYKVYRSFIDLGFAMKDLFGWIGRNNKLIGVAAGLLVMLKATKIANWISSVVASTTSYTVSLWNNIKAQKANAAALRGIMVSEYARAGKGIKGATAALKAFNVALFTNPWGIAVAAIGAIAAGFFLLKKSSDAVTKTIAKMNGEITAQSSGMNYLFTKLIQANKGTEERKNLVNQINELYGQYLPKMLTEADNLSTIEKARYNANEALRQEIILKTKNSELEELREKFSRKIERQNKKLLNADAAKQNPIAAGHVMGEFRNLQDEIVQRYLLSGKWSDEMDAKLGQFFADNWTFLGGSTDVLSATKRMRKIINDNIEYYKEIKRIEDFAAGYSNSRITPTGYGTNTINQPTMSADAFKAEEAKYKYALDQKRLVLMQEKKDKDAYRKAELKAEEEYLRNMLDLYIKKWTNEKTGAVVGGEQEILDARIALEKNLMSQVEDVKTKKTKDAFDAAVEEEKKGMERLKAMAKESYAAQEITKEQHDLFVLKLEQELQLKLIALAKKHGKETAEYEQKYFDLRIKQREQFEQIQSKASKVGNVVQWSLDYYENNPEKEDDLPAGVKDFIKDRRRKRSALGLDKDSGVESELAVFNTEDYDGQLSQLRTFLEAGTITHEEHERLRTEITREQTKQRIALMKSGLSAMSDLLGAYGSYVEAEKQRELEAAGNSKRKQAQIERKYAKKQQDIQIAQAVMKQSQAIMDLWGNNTIPHPFKDIYNAIMIPLILGTTALQIKTIKAQQFAKGRYPVLGKDDGRTYNANYVGVPRTGIYNEPSLGLFSEQPEMVIDNPTLRNIQINSPRLIEAIMAHRVGAGAKQGVKQYADGNYASVGGYEADPEMKKLMKKNLYMMQVLIDKPNKVDVETIDKKLTKFKETKEQNRL